MGRIIFFLEFYSYLLTLLVSRMIEGLTAREFETHHLLSPVNNFVSQWLCQMSFQLNNNLCV